MRKDAHDRREALREIPKTSLHSPFGLRAILRLDPKKVSAFLWPGFDAHQIGLGRKELFL
jgi:hypothetical protein